MSQKTVNVSRISAINHIAASYIEGMTSRDVFLHIVNGKFPGINVLDNHALARVLTDSDPCGIIYKVTGKRSRRYWPEDIGPDTQIIEKDKKDKGEITCTSR